jgi:filamentous hemagglutinin family protein
MQTNLHLVFLTSFGLIFSSQTAIAQIYQPSNRIPVADNTLGTQVSGTNNNFNITGGLNKGQTLFHSFTDFSVPTNGQANFANPIGNRDMITRVTGGIFSDINGLVNTNGANLLLINPQGVVFGPNVRLNTGKAFFATTANGVDLVDTAGRGYSFGVNGAGDASLLTVNPNVLFDPSKLIMGGSNSGSKGIVNYGTLQTGNDSQYIGLIGGNITLDGRDGGGKIVAPGGRVDLGGVNSSGTATIDNRTLVFGGNGLILSDVSLINGAQVNVRANQTLATVRPFFNNVNAPGSSININANNIKLTNDRSTTNTSRSSLDAGLAANSGIKTAPGGSINIDSTGSITLDNAAYIKNTILAQAGGKIGDVNIKANSLDLNNGSTIWSNTAGTGDTGKISFDIKGDFNIKGNSLSIDNPRTGLYSVVETTGVGNSQGIDIKAGNLSLTNSSLLRSGTFGRGNAGNINIATKNLNLIDASNIQSGNSGTGNGGDINITAAEDITISSNNKSLGKSTIYTNVEGTGNTGKIKIDAQGDVSLSNSSLFAGINKTGIGNSKGIDIKAKTLSLTNSSGIFAGNEGTGNSGSLDIKTVGNTTISGTDNPDLLTGKSSNALSKIYVNTEGKGNAGKISIDAGGDLVIKNLGGIFAGINKNGVGDSQGINIKAVNLKLTNNSQIDAGNFGQGSGGNIDINTSGNITISGTDNPKFVTNTNTEPLSTILIQINGKGDTGKITLNAKGDISINNRGAIFAGINRKGEGNSKGIEIRAKNLSITNFSNIFAGNNGIGTSGNIDIKVIGNLIVSGTDNLNFVPIKDDDAVSTIYSTTNGKGDTGKITIDAGGDVSVKNLGGIFAAILENGVGNSKGIDIKARNLKLQNLGFIQATNIGGKGDAGDINIKTTGVIDVLDSSRISSQNIGAGKANDVSIKASRVNLNKGEISTNGDTVSGGDILLNLDNLILLRNNSKISTNSASLDKNSSGGNITIDSPLIVALPGNNDITANAYNGTGGKVNITSQGLFGIQYYPLNSDFRNDITASSTFGRNGNVNIDTPGTDPGKEMNELPAIPNDASNQISQACGASQRENKFYITGRGGLPPTARDPLESEALWQDARAVTTKPAPTANRVQNFPQPAIGWRLDKNGRVNLIAAQTSAGAAGTRVVCPNQ